MKANADRDAEIIRLHHAERWPPGTIARELGVHASVVRRVLGQAGQVAESVAARPSMVEPYLPFIRETLAKHPKLRASRILEMVRGRGYKGQQSRFHEIIAELRPRPKAEAYLRLSTLPGEQWQVDWAHFGKLRVGRGRAPADGLRAGAELVAARVRALLRRCTHAQISRWPRASLRSARRRAAGAAVRQP
jgi:hypothetical protein